MIYDEGNDGGQWRGGAFVSDYGDMLGMAGVVSVEVS